MKARLQLALITLDNPRVVRMVLFGLGIALALVAPVLPSGAEAVYACPASGGDGCTGG